MIKNIIIIILILGFIAIIVFLNVPNVQKILAKRTEIDNQRQNLLDKQELLKTVEKLATLYEENKESIEMTVMVLPASEDIPNLIVQFEALAFEQGLILEKIDLSTLQKEQVTEESGQPTATKGLKKMSASINLMGTYPAFKNFTKAAEENMRLMDINYIKFSSKATQDESGEDVFGMFDFSVTLNIYYK